MRAPAQSFGTGLQLDCAPVPGADLTPCRELWPEGRRAMTLIPWTRDLSASWSAAVPEALVHANETVRKRTHDVVRPTPEELDEILAIQFSVAWAGETGGEPRRLAWWHCDLIDPEGGGDLLARLLPRTHQWAALSLARRAAGRVDALGRQQLATPDRVRTLFHLGFEVDEQLCDRVARYRRQGADVREVLRAHLAVGYPWSLDAFTAHLQQLPPAKTKETAAGRRITNKPKCTVEQVRMLAAALLPLKAQYPLPYFEAND